MPLPQENIYTIDDIYNLPDGQRAELYDGQIVMMAPPSTRHQLILNYINNAIYNYIKDNNGSCDVFPSPFAVYLNPDDTKNYLEPDISVICNKDKLDDKGCKGAPDWVVEIVSPSSKRLDYYNKLFKYRTAGVKEYWIVDPLDKTVTAHFFDNPDSPYKYTFDDIVKVNIYETLYINFKNITQTLNL